MGYTQIVAAQVKEKFGSLRFYYKIPKQVHISNTKWSNWDSYVHGAVDFAESLSHKTCEWCGAPGQGRVMHGYYYTSCDTHQKVG